MEGGVEGMHGVAGVEDKAGLRRQVGVMLPPARPTGTRGRRGEMGTRLLKLYSVAAIGQGAPGLGFLASGTAWSPGLSHPQLPSSAQLHRAGRTWPQAGRRPAPPLEAETPRCQSAGKVGRVTSIERDECEGCLSPPNRHATPPPPPSPYGEGCPPPPHPLPHRTAKGTETLGSKR